MKMPEWAALPALEMLVPVVAQGSERRVQAPPVVKELLLSCRPIDL
jgi:hypothetical protein